eukprot:scaffold25644_cov52-Attheya_sp.AAC.1
MLHDMGALVHRQKSAASILLYISAAYNYRIDKLIIGSHPYPDFIVPMYGAAYAQRSGTQPTPSVKVIQDHFHYRDDKFIKDVGNCVMESWKTLTGGYLWVNSVYALPTEEDDGDVDTIRRVEATIELMRTLFIYQNKTHSVTKIEVLAFGRQAAYVASNLSKRLSYNHIKCTIIRCDQPAKYGRITRNRDKVGKSKQYMCLTAKAMRCAQGIAERDIRYKMPAAIDSLINSGIKSISTDAQDLISNPPVYRKPCTTSTSEQRVASLEQALADMMEYNRKANDIMFRLVEMISTNAFVSATIQDRVIGTVESVTSSQTAPLARSSVYHTPASDPVILQVSTSNIGADDDQSSISGQSVSDMFTPRRVKSSTKRSSTTSDNQGESGSKSADDNTTVPDLHPRDLMSMLQSLPVEK